MAYGDAKRKIYFYRLLDHGTRKPLNRKAICKAIEDLKGKDCYFEDGDQVTRAKIYDNGAPQCIRFYKVRRDELPGKDDGQGEDADLDLDEDEGLSEAIHLRLFPNGIVAAEAFGHGPRATRFGLYVLSKLNMPCIMQTVIRHDVVDEALKLKDIRLLRFKLDPSEASEVAAAAESLRGVMSTAESLNTGVWAELSLRSERGDGSFTNRIKELLSNVFKGNNGSTASAFKRLEIEGKPDPDTPVASLDLLSERLYRTVEIPYRAERKRELDADAAFSAIKKAYDAVKHQLALDAQG
jgi:hypothetical protein